MAFKPLKQLSFYGITLFYFQEHEMYTFMTVVTQKVFQNPACISLNFGVKEYQYKKSTVQIYIYTYILLSMAMGM